MTKTCGTLGWPVRAFSVKELRAEPAGARRESDAFHYRDLVTAYNHLAGLRASAGGGSARCVSYLAALPVRKPCGAKAYLRKNCLRKNNLCQKLPQKHLG